MNEDLLIISQLFNKLYEQYSRVENKKFFYQDIKDLTVIEINTILVIGIGKKVKKMSEIADMLGVSYGTPTVTIDRLIKKELVVRTRDEEDRRQVFVTLSKSGEEIFTRVAFLKEKISERLFGVLNSDQQKALVEILSVVNKSFDEVFSKPFDWFFLHKYFELRIILINDYVNFKQL